MGIADLRTYLDTRFPEVKGWCAPHLFNAVQPLHEYQEAHGIRGPVGEIGVFHGKFFLALALLKRGQTPHMAFDVFDLQQFNLDGAGKGNLAAFEENLRSVGLTAEEVRIRRTDSMAISARDIEAIRDEVEAFSMFSVDGCHMAEHTINDFRIAMELTAPGGVIYIDDYLNQDWPGVHEGVAKLYMTDVPRFVPVAYTSNKLITCHISHAGEMLKHLRAFVQEKFPEVHMKPVRRYGYDCVNLRPDMTQKRYLA